MNLELIQQKLQNKKLLETLKKKCVMQHKILMQKLIKKLKIILINYQMDQQLILAFKELNVPRLCLIQKLLVLYINLKIKIMLEFLNKQ